MRVTAAKYRTMVQQHLKRFRPEEYRRATRDGDLDRRVNDLAKAIATWVNSQLPSNMPGESESKRLRKEHAALLMAESDALREYLPPDEREEQLIGPSGGYEDPVE